MKRRALGKGRRHVATLAGGPYAGEKVRLHSNGTLPIRVGKWWGRYDENNNWEDFTELP